MLGFKHSDDTKLKFSLARKGKFCGDKNGMYGKKHSEETIKNMSELAKKRKINPNSKKVSVNGLIFNSASEASRFLGVSSGTISYRCRQKTLNCFWID